MKDIKSNSFNETMSSLLIQLRNAVDNLSPEHIKMLPVNLVDKARSFTENEFIFDDNAMVNSVDGYKLNSMIRWMTSNNMEYMIGGEDILFGDDDTKRIIIDNTITVPEGWDGRNGFAFFENINTPLYVAQRSNGGSKVFAHLTITRNRSTIKISSYYYNQGKLMQAFPDYREPPIKFDDLKLRYILWRNKDV
jgi:hypothetical protein